MKGFLNYIANSGHAFKEISEGIFQGDIGKINWRIFYSEGADNKTWISIRRGSKVIGQFEDFNKTIEFIKENS